jgi:two-component system response regulator LytT
MNILVVEDENIVAKDIQFSLKRLGYNVVGISSTGEKAIELVAEKKPDLVLMDIMLKGEMSGIDAANVLRNEHDTPVIFLTAYADEATLAKAKITEPYGYIIKPFKEIDLHTSIEMALYKHSKTMDLKKEIEIYSNVVDNAPVQDFVFIKSNSRMVKVENSNIQYVEALKDYVIINANKEKFTIHSTMKDIQAKLPAAEFMRVHRSFIVRLDKIKAIEQSNLIVEGSEKYIPIGGSYKEVLMSKLNFM